MAVRATGFAMLASHSVQAVMDMALIAQAATLESRAAVHAFLRRLPHFARSQTKWSGSKRTICAP